MAGGRFVAGNKMGLALDDPDVRQDAYKDYCNHLAKGKAIKSWFYEKNGNHCSWMTMLSYIENHPSEFDSETRETAISKGYQKWEEVAEASAEGRNMKANTASLQMIMRNKYGWDKPQKEENKGLSVDDLKALTNALKQEPTVKS